MIKHFRFTIITLFSLLLMACASHGPVALYDGPALPSEHEATLTLPLEFELIELDGQAVSSLGQTFRTDALSVKFAPGPHTLILRYSNVFELDDENHDTLSSGQLIFKLNMEKGEHFHVVTSDITQYEQALAFIEQPVVALASKLKTVDASHIKKSNALILSKKEKPVTTQKPNLQQLQFWWQQASQYEQDAFLNWLKQ